MGDPQITLALIPAARDLPGSMVGEVFLASPTPRVNPVRAKLLAEHESRHVDQWAVFTLVAWAIGLWLGVVLLLARRRIRWTVRTALRRRSDPVEGRCPVHTVGST
ncbi:MAG: hypothetical protein WB473_05840 [Pedococcus sp.]